MRRNDALPRQPIQESSQRENSLRMEMRLGFLEQGEEVGTEATVGAEPELRQGLKDEHGGEAPAAKPVLSERQNGLFRLMKHDLSRPGQFFEMRGQWLNFDASNAGLCFGDSPEVSLKCTQDRAGLADASGQSGESVLESFTAFALFRVLIDLEISKKPAPDAGAIPQFLDEISRGIQEVTFESLHHLRGKPRRADGCPVAVRVGLKKRPPRRQHAALAARLEQGSNPDCVRPRGRITLYMQEALPQFRRESLGTRGYD